MTAPEGGETRLCSARQVFARRSENVLLPDHDWSVEGYVRPQVGV